MSYPQLQQQKKFTKKKQQIIPIYAETCHERTNLQLFAGYGEKYKRTSNYEEIFRI